MPRGWYLAQGLIPLDYSSSDDEGPCELPNGRLVCGPHGLVTLPDDSSTLVLMTDGACLNNGQTNPKAGWAFFQGLSTEGQPRVVTNALEKQGPWGDDAIQTSNRAELRPVIAALSFRNWPGEGFSTAVIATDSEYVVEGSTQWAKTWVRNGWKTRGQR